jgi:glyoxylase-like metal-dependent hydrolase (beta-lactamase superfamily II)
VGSVEALRQRYGFRVLAHEATRRALPAGMVDEGIPDGHVFNLGTWAGRPWRVQALHTPGHAPGHLALRDGRWGALFAGDLVSGLSSILVHPGEGDMAQYMASLQRCADLQPPLVLPGHGPAQPGEVFLKTLAHRRMREGKVVAALSADEPRTVEALVPLAYDDTPQEAWGLAARSLEAHLLKLEKDGAARAGPGGWRRAG